MLCRRRHPLNPDSHSAMPDSQQQWGIVSYSDVREQPGQQVDIFICLVGPVGIWSERGSLYFKSPLAVMRSDSSIKMNKSVEQHPGSDRVGASNLRNIQRRYCMKRKILMTAQVELKSRYQISSRQKHHQKGTKDSFPRSAYQHCPMPLQGSLTSSTIQLVLISRGSSGCGLTIKDYNETVISVRSSFLFQPQQCNGNKHTKNQQQTQQIDYAVTFQLAWTRAVDLQVQNEMQLLIPSNS